LPVITALKNAQGGLTVGQLKRRTGLPRNDIYDALDLLQERGQATRHAVLNNATGRVDVEYQHASLFVLPAISPSGDAFCFRRITLGAL
jgi:IclR helix-turn-helix domain